MLKTKVNPSELITTGQAGLEEFDPPCSSENVRRLARAGRLQVAAIVGRGQMLFSRQEVRRFIETRRESQRRG